MSGQGSLATNGIPCVASRACGLRRRQPAAVLLRVEGGVIAEPGRHPGTGGFGVDAIELRPLPKRPGKPVPPLDRARQDARAGLGEAEVRHRVALPLDPAAAAAQDRSDHGLVLLGGDLGDRCEHGLRVTASDVDVVGHHGVDRLPGKQAPHACRVIRGPGAGADRERAAHRQAARPAGVDRERGHAPGVADDPHPAPERQRLGLEELRGVEELLTAVEAHHAGLTQQRVDQGVPTQSGRGMRACPGAQARHPASLDGQDRLAPGDPPRDAAEVLRVAEGLHVEDDRPRGLVLLPVLEQVVGRDIGAAAE